MQRSMEASRNVVSCGQIRAKKMFGHLSNKLEAGIKFGAKASVYDADVTAVELTTAQCMILAMFHGLLMNDLAFCQVCQKLFTKVEQLKSPYLISWLRDDFQFNGLDVVRVLIKLAHLVQDRKLIVPDYILRIFVGLNAKYGVIEICEVMKDLKTIHFLKSIDGSCSRSQQTDPIPVPLSYALSKSPTKFASLSYDNSVDVTKDPGNHDSGLNSSSTQRNHSLSKSMFNVENRSRSKSRTRNHNVPRDHSRPRKNTERDISEFKGTTLKNAKSYPNILEKLEKDVEKPSEIALVHSFLSKSKPISPSDIRRLAVRKDERVGTYPIHQAARDGLLDVVKALINIGAPVNCKDDEGLTPVHYAAQAGNIDILEVLKIHGAELSAEGDTGSTPLHLAAWNNHSETCGWLINHGVPIEAQAYKGRTALHRAAIWGHMDTVRLLVGRGASIHAKDFYKSTPYDLALTQGHLLVANMLKINS